MKIFSMLACIVLLASFLRLYMLSSVPPSPSLDEVSIGYNAYSILDTGKDEYGTRFPMLLRAYDDWRPALYAYLVIPFVKMFGLSVLAVRLPSVILSVLTVFATYFLVKELFKRWDIALLTTFLLTISPWHIYISRLGHEVNAGLAFFIFGMLFFLKEKFPLSAAFFALSFISYQSEKIFLPILLFGIFFLFKDRILQKKKQAFFSLLIICFIVAPFIKATLEPNALIRFRATNIFDGNKERFEKQAILLANAVKERNLLGEIFYNRRVVATQIFFEGYISHFNPVWVFTNPSNDRHKVPNLGLLYIWEAPFFILGIIFLVFGNFDKKNKYLIFFWMLIAPLPAAITTDAPHALRIYQMLPIPQILTSIGLLQTFSFLKNYHIGKVIFTSLFSILVVSSLLYFYYEYFIIFPKTQSASFQYAISKAIPFVLETEKSYNKIVFSNKDNLYQSYMFFLFYSKYDPRLYQKQGGTKSGGFAETHTFGKYTFRPFNFVKEDASNTIYIGNNINFPTGISFIKKFANLDGKEVIEIVQKR